MNTQVLKPIVELGIGHLNGQLLENICLLGVKIEAHLAQPVKGLGVVDLVFDQGPGHVTLVHELGDLKAKQKIDFSLPNIVKTPLSDKTEILLTRCSSFLLRRGGCSISTVSAKTLRVASTFDSTACMGVMSPPPEMVVSADSMFSDHAI